MGLGMFFLSYVVIVFWLYFLVEDYQKAKKLKALKGSN
jgi:hypothetical protein